MNYLEQIIEEFESNDFFNRSLVVDKNTTIYEVHNQMYAQHLGKFFKLLERKRRNGWNKFLVLWDTDWVSIYPIDTEEQIKELYEKTKKE